VTTAVHRASPLGPSLVTGATGMLGGHVVREVLAAGAPEVFVVVRSKDGHGSVERFDALRGAVDGGDRLRLIESNGSDPIDLPASIETVVHCAALVDFATEEGIVETNVAATWHLLCAAARLPTIKRFLHVGSLTIRTDSESDFAECDLDTGQRFVAPYTLTKFLAEVMIRKLHRAVPVTIVRAGTILPSAGDLGGAGSDWFRNTVKLWAQGRLAAVPMAPEQAIYPVVASDLAATMVALLHHDDAPDVLHLPARPGPPAGRIFELIADALQLEPPRLLAQHSAEWQAFRATLPSVVRRVIDGLYPPPPPGARLASVDSRVSDEWLDRHGIQSPTVDDGYWPEFAASVARVTRARREAACT
jgi:dihydroflavonol-4-reductase